MTRNTILRCAGALHFGLLLWFPAFAGSFGAEPLPNPDIPGFRFPESEATVLGWVYQMERGDPVKEAPAAFENIHLHGWGIWTALTMPTSQIYERKNLRVFETWYSMDEMVARAGANADSAAPRRRPRMRDFFQLHRGQAAAAPDMIEVGQDFAQIQMFDIENGLPLPFPPAPPVRVRPAISADRVIGFVKLDPTSAGHIAKQGLLRASNLNALILGGAQQVPAFPNTSLTLKAVFQVITAKQLVGGRYYRLKIWSGPPSAAIVWGPSRWPGCVWIDVQGGGSGSGAVDLTGSTDGSSRTDATTYPVSSLINYQLGASEAVELSSDPSGIGAGAQAGDFAILVAMHVAGREITRWTWQTFWWTPTPDDPKSPSSQTIAGLRPAQLRGAPRNYAMALAYDMEVPGQPNTGGANIGLPIYAYNPWLEAGFSPSDLPDSKAGFGPDGLPAPNNVGVQSNCMSCHARSNYNPGKLSSAPRYSGARYVDLNDPQFAGTLQMDFLWSLVDNAQ